MALDVIPLTLSSPCCYFVGMLSLATVLFLSVLFTHFCFALILSDYHLDWTEDITSFLF